MTEIKKKSKRPTKKLLKASEVFKVGNLDIGWIGPNFQSKFKDATFEVRPTPTCQTFSRPMNDYAIESELKPGYSTLGDVHAFLQNPPEGSKDGYVNLFYFEGCVVCVDWSGRGVFGLRAGGRVFSPATGASTPMASQPSESLPSVLTINGVKY